MGKMEKIKNKKVVYFADPLLSIASETIEDEFNTYIKSHFEAKGIEFTNVTCIDTPPFGKLHYDILIFDWGGMSMGNSLLEHFCRQILKEAEDRPNTYYVMASTMTKYAMEDALDELDTNLHNVFLDIDKFISFYKKIEMSV
jgi:hypothetical protein